MFAGVNSSHNMQRMSRKIKASRQMCSFIIQSRHKVERLTPGPFERRLCVSWLGPNGGGQTYLQPHCVCVSGLTHFLRQDKPLSGRIWSN